jgi:putative ABC transport system permease protein
MALLGIVNTLNLSVYERTRELGMLRAMGMTARQARILIRNESLITAAIGSIVGVALGVFLAWAVIHSVRDEGIVFSPPWLQVLGVFAVGLASGVVAAQLPARRASRLDVLAAIAHE